jgi:hypothetical protein
VELLIRLDRMADAKTAYEVALRQPSASLHPEQVEQLAAALATHTSEHSAP